jgi:hypothetical protein
MKLWCVYTLVLTQGWVDFLSPLLLYRPLYSVLVQEALRELDGLRRRSDLKDNVKNRTTFDSVLVMYCISLLNLLAPEFYI